MLEKLITNLKNSLPEPIRKKLGMAEESDEEVEASEEDELQRYEADDAPDTEAEDKKKKQISMILRVVIILGLAYFAVDEFVLKKNNSDQSVDELLAKIPAKNNRRKKPAVAVDPASAQVLEGAKATAEAAATATPETPGAIADTTTPAQVPPIENVNILDKNETSNAVSPESQLQIETPATEAPVEVTETKVVDTSVDKKLDQLIDNVDQSTETTEEVTIPSQPLRAQPEVAPKKETSMASKIAEDISETPPPAYDQVGRGLVYNCKDKYWACVDKPAYVHCNKNMKWNKSKGNSMECVVQNIYSSDEDCAKIQKYNVSTSVATSFCQGN